MSENSTTAAKQENREKRDHPSGVVAGSNFCPECGCTYFSKWGHGQGCSLHPKATQIAN